MIDIKTSRILIIINLVFLVACSPVVQSSELTASPPTPTPTSLPSQTNIPLPTQAQVSTSTPTAPPTLSGSGGGVIAFASLENNEWQIYILNADGSGKQQVTIGIRGGYEPNWSPDGTKIIFQYGGFRIADIITGEIVRIPLSVDGNQLPNEYLVKPAWCPDGEWIAFLNENGTRGDIYLIRPDGIELRRLTESNDISRDGNLVWSPDGKQLAYSAYRDNRIEIFVMDVESAIQGKINSQQLTNSLPAVRNLVTSWSPDGSRLAFSSDQDGNSEIYLTAVMSFA
jgi:WD40 repeat protein